MPICSLCKHELKGHICKDCAEAMAKDIIKLQKQVEGLERDLNRAIRQMLKLSIEAIP